MAGNCDKVGAKLVKYSRAIAEYSEEVRVALFSGLLSAL